MVINLHTTESPVSRLERNKINENWDRIINGLTHIQHQINLLAGGVEIEETIRRITEAAQNAMDATINAEHATELANDATTNSLEATQDAIKAKEEAEKATAEALIKIAEVSALIVKAQPKIDEMDVLISTGSTLQSDLEILKTQLETELTNSQTAIANANAAYEKIKGWGMAKEWNATGTYSKNNVVTRNGSTFQSKVDNNTSNPPTVTNANWILLAQRGVDGTGSVASVNGNLPDVNGNVNVDIYNEWNSILNKPTTFTPSAHSHAISDVTGLQNALDNKADKLDLTALEQTTQSHSSNTNVHLQAGDRAKIDRVPTTAQMTDWDSKFPTFVIHTDVIDESALDTVLKPFVLATIAGQYWYAETQFYAGVGAASSRVQTLKRYNDVSDFKIRNFYNGVWTPWSPSLQDLKSSVSDLKSKVAEAITDKGVTTSPTATGGQMTANIRAIQVNNKASGLTEIFSNKLTVNSLGFTPKYVFGKLSQTSSFFGDFTAINEVDLMAGSGGNKQLHLFVLGSGVWQAISVTFTPVNGGFTLVFETSHNLNSNIVWWVAAG